jgi:hypothetical protein
VGVRHLLTAYRLQFGGWRRHARHWEVSLSPETRRMLSMPLPRVNPLARPLTASRKAGKTATHLGGTYAAYAPF